MFDDDSASAPIVPTARRPGYDPPFEYVEFLDLGGELAELDSLKRSVTLKAAVKVLKARTIFELSSLIDATGNMHRHRWWRAAVRARSRRPMRT